MTTGLGEAPSKVCPMLSKVSFSIVSHGHGRFVELLLGDFRSLRLPSYEILITLNIEEDEGFISRHEDLPITVIRNSTRRGFGENHNKAFSLASGEFFAVVNPDVRLKNDFVLDPILASFADATVGLCAPAVYSSSGELEDSARKFPTVALLLGRKLRRRNGPDYSFGTDPMTVDWVAGMFMVFRREVFATVRGFDERYFMYFEDVDICYRVTQAGFSVVLNPLARITHDAQRASRRNLKHVAWHVQSAFRFLVLR